MAMTNLLLFFVVIYSLDCREGHMKKSKMRLLDCGKVKGQRSKKHGLRTRHSLKK
jgi:hypothetical protein